MNSDLYIFVHERFCSYLEQKGFRKTPERFAILKEVYSRTDHFDVESLYISMRLLNYRVSRATIYNTLELLIEADLVSRHQFGKNTSFYEKSHGFKQHDHLVCLDCGKVFEFCDPRIAEIQSQVGDLLKFKIDRHSLTFYAKCLGCDLEKGLEP